MTDTTWIYKTDEPTVSKKEIVPTTRERTPAQLVRDHLFGPAGHDFFTILFQGWARDERIYGLVVAYVETGEVPGSDMHERRANAGTLATLAGLDWGEAAEIAELFSRYRSQEGLAVAANYSTGGKHEWKGF